MVTNSFRNKNFMQPMGRLSMHSKCLDFFLLSLPGGEGGGKEDFFLFSFVPNMFPLSSQCAPIRFPKGVPNSTSL